MTSLLAVMGMAAQSGNLPEDGGLGMLPAGSSIAEEVHFFHNGVLLPIITVICLIVLSLLLWVIVRYNSKANPVPHKFSHNTLVEVIWTGVPILILLAIALPSFDLLYNEDIVPDGRQFVFEADGSSSAYSVENDFPRGRMAASARHVHVFRASADGVRGLVSGDDYDIEGLGSPSLTVRLKETPAAGDRVLIRVGRSLVGAPGKKEIALAPSITLKVIGYQWGWTYFYPDFGDFEFSANMTPRERTTPELYRFETDNHVVLPVGETIRVVTTGRDVIHSWTLPNYAIKIDAVPGRINETWFKAEREGVYYGQCSEICGVRHSAMPIAVDVVSRAKFEAWVDEKRAEAGLQPMFQNVADARSEARFAAAAAGAPNQ
jgi:cytochrome c oxidase subunit 2